MDEGGQDALSPLSPLDILLGWGELGSQMLILALHWEALGKSLLTLSLSGLYLYHGANAPLPT